MDLATARSATLVTVSVWLALLKKANVLLVQR